METIDAMGRALATVAVLAAATAVAACGGSHAAPSADPPKPPPVAQQVHDALQSTLQGLPPGQAFSAGRERLPYAAIGACTGPGRAGSYRCATTPRGARGVRSVTVDVHADGTWASEQFRVVTTLHGRRTAARSAVWGVGIRLPR